MAEIPSPVKLSAVSKSGSRHVVVGVVAGGVPNESSGVLVPFTSPEQGKAYLEHIGWTDIQEVK